MLKNTRENKDYVSILADGTLRVVVPEGTENAVKREYETSDGKTGTKHELVFTEISGIISKVAFFDGDFGKLLQLTLTDGEEKPLTLSVSTETNFGEDLMKKLPAIDMDNYVRLVPYSFNDENTGKTKKGVTVYQGQEENEEGEMVDIKIGNYFYDTDKKKNLHKFPEAPTAPKGKEVSKEKWKMYFMEARIFLIDFITDFYDLENQDSDDVDEVDTDEEGHGNDDEDTEDDDDWRDDETRKKHPKAPPVKKTASKKATSTEVKPSGYKGKLHGGKKGKPEF